MRLLILPLLIAGCAKQSNVEPAVAKAPDSGRPAPTEGEERPLLLWEARKGDAVSTLMGTCHLSIPLDHALPDEHRGRLTDARILVNEVDMAEAANPLVSMPIIWDGDYDLREVIGEENFHALAVSTRNGMPAPMLIHMRPWLAASSRMIRLGVSVPMLDGAVDRLARTSELDRRALETLAEQAALLGRFDELFMTELRPLTEDEEREREQATAALSEGCVDGDLAAVERAMSLPTSSQMNPELLDARNEAWAAAVVEEATAGGMFLAVGAGHMFGDTGMLALLEREGFEISALTTRAAAVPPPSGILNSSSLELQPMPDPAAVEAWITSWSQEGGPIAGMCAPDQVVPKCFAPVGRTCEEALTEDARLCANAFFDQLPPDPSTALAPTAARQVFGCAATGAIMSAIGESRVADEPTCNQLLSQMAAASATAVGGR